MRYSPQRELVLAAVRDYPHLSAEDIYHQLISSIHDKCFSISLATVYRNLNQLLESGYIQKISFPGGADHFEGNLTPHFHLICEHCGKIIDAPFPKAHMDEQFKMYAFTAHHAEILIHGLCHECEHYERKR